MTVDSLERARRAADAWLEAELKRWRAAAARQPLIEGRWGALPMLPASSSWDVAFDPTGRRAILIGAEALYLLDLRTARARLLLDRAGTDRVKRQGGLRAGGLTVAGEGEAGALSVSEDDPDPPIGRPV